MFIAAIGGGSVQNDGYIRLEQFIELEKNNALEQAQQNPKNYDSMLAIDIQQFKNSDEFKAYLKKNDTTVDTAEAISVGWLFVLLADIAMMCIQLVLYTFAL